MQFRAFAYLKKGRAIRKRDIHPQKVLSPGIDSDHRPRLPVFYSPIPADLSSFRPDAFRAKEFIVDELGYQALCSFF